MTPRKYEQRLRAQAADETRRRILDALYERLRDAPSEQVSLDKVARLAGVSRSTVYLVFGSRTALFDALGADLLVRGGFQGLVESVLQPDALAGLREGLRGGVSMYAAHRDVMRALYSMAQLDADAVGGAVQRMERGRASGMDGLAERLAGQGVLREGVTADDASTVLWLLSSFDSFDLLYTGRGLTADQVAESLVRAAERALCR
ncbi:TetR/AcrR family transcriptional regulator [Streptomyces sp. NPDC091292]|uniref:TetR/AcrR family transcriptional regulator n=1 Tax=Streptomyces sp. NPDC091292 TaxID=3365991 RepID=UPI0038287A3B